MIYNTINGKLYVGITNNLRKRWKYHRNTPNSTNKAIKFPIHRAIAKYGIANFIFKEIEQLETQEEANRKEIEYIKTLREMNYKLYNVTDGGESGPVFTEEKRKEYSERMSGENNYFYGKKLSGSANGHYGHKMKDYVKNILLTYRTKITDEQVEEIKNLYATKQMTQTDMSKKFNIALSQINRIIHGHRRNSDPNQSKPIKANLKPEQVLEIRKLYSEGNIKQKELAKNYNISENHISQIVTRQKWKNI